MCNRLHVLQLLLPGKTSNSYNLHRRQHDTDRQLIQKYAHTSFIVYNQNVILRLLLISAVTLFITFIFLRSISAVYSLVAICQPEFYLNIWIRYVCYTLQMVYRDSTPTACLQVSRKCTGCGRDVTSEARYCDWCGSQVCIQTVRQPLYLWLVWLSGLHTNSQTASVFVIG